MVWALRYPPEALVSRAISPTPRVGVPLKYMCSSTCEIPTSSSGSSKYPAFTHVTIAATGAPWSSRMRTVRPLGRTVRVTGTGRGRGGNGGNGVRLH